MQGKELKAVTLYFRELVRCKFKILRIFFHFFCFQIINFQNVGFYCSERETVFAITKKLGVLKIASTVDESTRYVVSDQEGIRTVNVMRALVKGIPIVTIEWVSFL